VHFALQKKLVLLLTFYYLIQMFIGYFNYFEFLKIVLCRDIFYILRYILFIKFLSIIGSLLIFFFSSIFAIYLNLL